MCYAVHGRDCARKRTRKATGGGLRGGGGSLGNGEARSQTHFNSAHQAAGVSWYAYCLSHPNTYTDGATARYYCWKWNRIHPPTIFLFQTSPIPMEAMAAFTCTGQLHTCMTTAMPPCTCMTTPMPESHEQDCY